MSRAYPGGILTANPPATTGPGGDYNDGGTASGVWTLADASRLKGSSLWPSKLKDKALWAWGWSYNGALGNNSDSAASRISSPTQLGTGVDWVKVTCTIDTTGAIKSDGTLWMWGNAAQGALGQNNYISKSSPAQTGAETNWAEIHAGRTSLGVKTNGQLWVWGSNDIGQLGIGPPYTTHRSSPVQLGTQTDWAKPSGYYQNVGALKTTGAFWLWGYNYYGTIGRNDRTNAISPVQVAGTWLTAAVGRYHAGGIKTDGTMWLWGHGAYGLMGQNDTNISRSSPVQVAGTDWAKLDLGHSHNMAIKSNGTLWGWGSNGNGQLGNNANSQMSSPIQIGALTSWSEVFAHNTNTFILKNDGTLWSMGRGDVGATGLNTRFDNSSPTQVGSRTDWYYVNGKGSTSSDTQFHSFGITAS